MKTADAILGNAKSEAVRDESGYGEALNKQMTDLSVLVATLLSRRSADADETVELRDRHVRYRGDFDAYEFRLSAMMDGDVIAKVERDPETADGYRVTPGAAGKALVEDGGREGATLRAIGVEMAKDYRILLRDGERN